MLPLFELALNTSVHASTGFAPHAVLFGSLPRLPIDFATAAPSGQLEDEWPPVPGDITTDDIKNLHDKMRAICYALSENQAKAAEAQKRQFDKGHKPLILAAGDLVLLSTTAHPVLDYDRKHHPRYVGPFVVEKQIHENSYRLRGLSPSVPKTQNVQFLRPFRPSTARHALRPESAFAKLQLVDGEIEWLVEAIIDRKNLRNGRKYKIKWANCNQPQWMKESDLVNCRELLREYHTKMNLPPPSTNFDAPDIAPSSDDKTPHAPDSLLPKATD